MTSPERTVLAEWDNRLVYSIHNPKVHYFVNCLGFFLSAFKRPMLGEGKHSFQPSDEITVKGMLHIVSQCELMNVTNVHGRARTANYRHVLYAAFASL